jgi:EAL domain-containing protein (putative c-di-GMP-specific phosphodiesterase class I)/GGDEF domain-containing protein
MHRHPFFYALNVVNKVWYTELYKRVIHLKKQEYRSILDKYSIYIFTIGVGLILILVAFTTSVSIRRYEDELVIHQNITLSSTSTEFSSHLFTIESSVDSIALGMSTLIGNKTLTENEMVLYKTLLENMFTGFLLKDEPVSNSIYLYFNPELTGTAHDVWMTLEDDNTIIKQTEIPLSRYVSKLNMSWFYGPKEDRTNAWVEPYYDRFGDYITSYVAPIYYEDRFIGVIGMYLDLSIVENVILNQHYVSEEFISMLDSSNRVIHHPEYNSGYLVDLEEELNSCEGVFKTSTLSNDWTLIYQNNENIIVKQRIEQGLNVIISLIIIFSLFYLLTFGYRKNYQKRTKTVITEIDKLSSGDYSSRITVPYHDELGIMSKAFNKAIDHIEELHRNLEEVAYYHSTSLLPNTNKLISDFTMFIQSHNNSRITICYIKFGKLSTVNDLISYEAGSDYLLALKEKLLLLEDESTTLYHSHGDSFIFLSVLKEKPCSIKDEITKLFNDHILIKDIEFDLKIRIGTAIYPDHSIIPNEVVRSAEIAVNQCTNSNPFVVYEPKIYDKLFSNNVLVVDFKKALEMKEFVMHYQPIINIKTGKTDYVEALVRWNHPINGLIYPDEFIGYAEETGLIVKLSEIILEEVCIQMRDWKYKGIELNVAINISSKEILERDFVSKICNTLLHYKINPSFVHLEITERSRLTDNLDSIKKLEQLKDYGCSIVLDDFGTGYSSFSYIQEIPLATIKLDKILLDNLDYEKNIALVESIVLMIKKLNLVTVVEGVETLEQLDFCKHLNVKYVQGYFFSKPLLPKRLIPFIQTFNKEGNL